MRSLIKHTKQFILLAVVPLTLVSIILHSSSSDMELPGENYYSIIAVLIIAALLGKWWIWQMNNVLIDGWIVPASKKEKDQTATKYADFFFGIGASTALYILGIGFKPDGVDSFTSPTIGSDEVALAMTIGVVMTSCGVIIHVIVPFAKSKI